jgi:hypothetical protein
VSGPSTLRERFEQDCQRAEAVHGEGGITAGVPLAIRPVHVSLEARQSQAQPIRRANDNLSPADCQDLQGLSVQGMMGSSHSYMCGQVPAGMLGL